METNRCAHFSMETQNILVSETGVQLRVPIRRCALAEQMILHLSSTAEGLEIARKITISDSSLDPAVLDAHRQNQMQNQSILPTTLRAAFGPDLEVIHASECTVQRCQESCTPGYKSFLRHFGLLHIAESETGVGCYEQREAAAEEFPAP